MEENAIGVCAEQLSLFRSRLSLRRLDDPTLELLQSTLVSGDVVSLNATRFALRAILRSEISTVLEEASSKPVEEKLRVLGFFVCAFALAGDAETRLALKYEALLFREDGCTKSPWLKVSFDEWITLAQDSFDNGFYSIAIKCCDNTLSCVPSTVALDPRGDLCQSNESALEKVQQLRDTAMALSASHSVQALTSKYLRKKAFQGLITHEDLSTDMYSPASNKFRNGIKKRNMLKLREFHFHAGV